jgi:ubiquitin carboxyl-terminal hydrolase 16
VGLVNPANDCFINSTVQALAGLGDLRLYLIRETHRRAIDEAAVYRDVGELKEGGPPAWKVQGLQEGLVTQALKDLLDALNERPIYRKTISVAPFVQALEGAFKQRISRQQQDAQEFLQVVAERLCDEYHAGGKARKRARSLPSQAPSQEGLEQRLTELSLEAAKEMGEGAEDTEPTDRTDVPPPVEEATCSEIKAEPTAAPARGAEGTPVPGEEEDGFPLEGRYESQIECQTCHFKPAPSVSTFCTLTLNVPQLPSTSLETCFDGMFKTEYIDDFKCEKCRLVAGLDVLNSVLSKSSDPEKIEGLKADIAKVEHAIENDPEHPPEGVPLPSSKDSPKRRIARHIRVVHFPKVLALHLSRSIFDARTSMKNSARVAFPEELRLGGLLDQRKYRLLSTVTHKGSHYSGHYETFRRQSNAIVPFANENTFEANPIFTRSSPAISSVSTPQLNPSKETDDELSTIENVSCADTGAASTTDASATSPKDTESTSIRSLTRSSLSKVQSTISRTLSRSPSKGSTLTPPTPQKAEALKIKKAKQQLRRRRKASERWWRISDDKIKESKTSEVLGMQREVYLLFYELER